MKIYLNNIWLFLLPFWSFGQQLEYTSLKVDATQHPDTMHISIYFETSSDGTAQALPLRIIGNDLNTIVDLRCVLGTVNFPLEIDIQGNQRVGTGTLNLPPSVEKDGTLAFGFRYKWPIQGNTITIPILHPKLPAASAESDTFESLITLPKDKVLRSQFPAMSWQKELKEEQVEYSFQLQVLPAWIKFKVYDDKSPFWSLERMVDFGVLLTLIVLGILGWNYLSKNRAS